MGDQVNITTIEEGYSSRINDLHMYNAVRLKREKVLIIALCWFKKVFLKNNFSIFIVFICNFPSALPLPLDNLIYLYYIFDY